MHDNQTGWVTLCLVAAAQKLPLLAPMCMYGLPLHTCPVEALIPFLCPSLPELTLSPATSKRGAPVAVSDVHLHTNHSSCSCDVYRRFRVHQDIGTPLSIHHYGNLCGASIGSVFGVVDSEGPSHLTSSSTYACTTSRPPPSGTL
jgi:hypothetical protein